MAVIVPASGTVTETGATPGVMSAPPRIGVIMTIADAGGSVSMTLEDHPA